MSLDYDGLVDKAASHAAASGHFERVNQHEPKNAPGNGITAAVWVDSIRPVRSGLASTSALVTINVRIFSNMLAEPQDAIDPRVVAAADALMGAYSGDFEFGGTVRMVDLLGAYGEGLTAQAGYIEQDHKMFRVITVSVPLVVNDVWSQAP